MTQSKYEFLAYLEGEHFYPFNQSNLWEEIAPGQFLSHFWEQSFDKIYQVQKALREFLRTHPHWHFHLIGNHPACATMGRGLQKGSGLNLIQPQRDFSKIPLPYFEIERGGDLTLHYPGQLIWYHLAKLHPIRWPMGRHLEHLLHSVAQAVSLQTDIALTPQRTPLGLWHQGTKYASVGMGIQHHVTTHGIALNVNWVGIERQFFFLLGPCGLSGEIYGALTDLTNSQKLSPQIIAQKLVKILAA